MSKTKVAVAAGVILVIVTLAAAHHENKPAPDGELTKQEGHNQGGVRSFFVDTLWEQGR